MKSYKIRLYPNKEQRNKLDKTINLCRFTYNKLLEILNKEDNFNKLAIQHYIVELKELVPELRQVYSKTLQYECQRLYANLKGLAVKKAHGFKVGRLRFKGERWFKTITYNQSGYKLIERDQRYDLLHLSKIGDIKARVHRKIEGNIKQIFIKKKTFFYEAIIVTNAEYKNKCGDKYIGIDLGVLSFLTTSENEKIENPLYMNKSLKQLQSIYQNLSRTKKRSKNRKKIIKQLCRKWEKINNQKDDFFHKTTKWLIDNCNRIGIEKLNIKSMTRKTNKNKYHNMRNILDTSWGKFISILKCKAESAGVDIIEVNPMNTSKMCHKCGNIQKINLNQRVYKCAKCNISIDRDYNAALNILKRSTQELGVVEPFGANIFKCEAGSYVLKSEGFRA